MSQPTSVLVRLTQLQLHAVIEALDLRLDSAEPFAAGFEDATVDALNEFEDGYKTLTGNFI